MKMNCFGLTVTAAKDPESLLYAIQHGSMESLHNRLLDLRTRDTLWDRDINGWTLLHHATYQMRPEVIEVLISHGFDCDTIDYCGRTPEFYADPLHRQADPVFAVLLDARPMWATDAYTMCPLQFQLFGRRGPDREPAVIALAALWAKNGRALINNGMGSFLLGSFFEIESEHYPRAAQGCAAFLNMCAPIVRDYLVSCQRFLHQLCVVEEEHDGAALAGIDMLLSTPGIVFRSHSHGVLCRLLALDVPLDRCYALVQRGLRPTHEDTMLHVATQPVIPPKFRSIDSFNRLCLVPGTENDIRVVLDSVSELTRFQIYEYRPPNYPRGLLYRMFIHLQPETIANAMVIAEFAPRPMSSQFSAFLLYRMALVSMSHAQSLAEMWAVSLSSSLLHLLGDSSVPCHQLANLMYEHPRPIDAIRAAASVGRWSLVRAALMLQPVTTVVCRAIIYPLVQQQYEQNPDARALIQYMLSHKRAESMRAFCDVRAQQLSTMAQHALSLLDAGHWHTFSDTCSVHRARYQLHKKLLSSFFDHSLTQHILRFIH